MRYLYAVLALQALIVLHEAAHAVAARLLGLGVRRFSVGFGPPLKSWHFRGTLISLRAVPLGAFAQLPEPLGEAQRWKRALVLLAGPAANWACALTVLFFLYLAGTHVAVPMTVGAVEPGSEAAQSLLRPGDLVIAADGAPLDQWSELIVRVSDTPNVPIELTVVRRGDAFRVWVTPRPDGNGVGHLGLSQQYVYREHPPFEAAAKSLAHVRRLLSDGASHFWRLARGGRSEWLPSAVPLLNQASDAASTGLDAFFRVVAALSIALGALTLLPVPSLDGGRLALLAVEAATGRRPSGRVEVALHALGFVLLALAILALAARGIASGRL